MIIVIFSVCVLAIILGFILLYYDCDISAGIMVVGGILGGIVSFIVVIVLAIDVSSIKVIDRKIEMYQAENKQIEIQISECVKQYQQYETEIFTEVAPKSSVTLVALYPELKSDTLVTKQIETYVANNEKIKELKEQKINGDVYRWWLYFGSSKKEGVQE